MAPEARKDRADTSDGKRLYWGNSLAACRSKVVMSVDFTSFQFPF